MEWCLAGTNQLGGRYGLCADKEATRIERSVQRLPRAIFQAGKQALIKQVGLKWYTRQGYGSAT